MKRTLLALMLLLIAAPAIFCQEDVLRPKWGEDRTKGTSEWDDYYSPFTFGVEAGLNFNAFSQKMTWFQQHGTIFNDLENAEGFSPHFGIMGEVPISKNLGIQLKLAYDKKYVAVSTTGYDYATDYIGNTTKHNMSLDVESKADYFTFTPLLRINITDRWFATVGPTFHFLLGDVETTWKPATKDGSSLVSIDFWNYLGFGNETAGSRTYSDAGKESVRSGIEIGAGYKIPISKKVWLVPQLRLQAMFTNITKDQSISNIYGQTIETPENRAMHSLQFALAVWFGY